MPDKLEKKAWVKAGCSTFSSVKHMCCWCIDVANRWKWKVCLEIVCVFDPFGKPGHIRKWPEVYAMSSTATTATVQQFRKIFATHGLPQIIVSDNGPQFVSEDFKQFCNWRGIQHNIIAFYHSHSNYEVNHHWRLTAQITHTLNVVRVWHACHAHVTCVSLMCDMRGVNHTCVGFLDSTCSIYTRSCFYTCACLYG